MNCFTVRRSETKSLIAPGISVSGNRIRIGINSSESMTSHVRFDKINPPVIDDNPKIISLASLKRVNPQRPYYVLERQSSTSFYNFAIVKVSTANIADTADLSYNGFISSIKGILAPIIVIRAKIITTSYQNSFAFEYILKFNEGEAACIRWQGLHDSYANVLSYNNGALKLGNYNTTNF